ncbi:MAG TPA: hypothetical protein DCY48_00200 [Candidatus Magasanikbacteria bacterium]|nr:hypothetical protein [Candidatus Magasanikbacteria bacterium]
MNTLFQNMKKEIQGLDLQKKKLGEFGLIVGGVIMVIGLWPLLFRGEPILWWLFVVGAALFAAGIIAPSLLRWPYVGWMAVGLFLGFFVSRIILGIVFFLFFTPIGWAMRAMGKRPLDLRISKEASSYWIKRDRSSVSNPDQLF